MKRLPKVDGGGVDLGVGRDVGDGGEEEVHLAGVVGLVDGGPVEPGWQLNRLYKSPKKLTKMAQNIAQKIYQSPKCLLNLVPGLQDVGEEEGSAEGHVVQVEQRRPVGEHRVDVDLLDVRLVGDHVLRHLEFRVQVYSIQTSKKPGSLIFPNFPGNSTLSSRTTITTIPAKSVGQKYDAKTAKTN